MSNDLNFLEEPSNFSVSHMIIPYALLLVVRDWRLILLLAYVWESFETVLHLILGGEYFIFAGDVTRESVEDSLILDPLQALIGVAVSASLVPTKTKTDPAKGQRCHWVSRWSPYLFLLTSLTLEFDEGRAGYGIFVLGIMFFSLAVVYSRVYCGKQLVYWILGLHVLALVPAMVRRVSPPLSMTYTSWIAAATVLTFIAIGGVWGGRQEQRRRSCTYDEHVSHGNKFGEGGSSLAAVPALAVRLRFPTVNWIGSAAGRVRK